MISRRTAVFAGAAAAIASAARAATGPSAVLASEDGRKVQVWIWPAVGPRERGVILFSPGALSAPDKYLRLIRPWTQAGFKVLAPLHIDSTDHPDHARYTMKDSWAARLYDMRALATFAAAPAYVAAGHSYGALVALTLGGAQPIAPAGWTLPLRDPRAKSVVAFSPPGPAPTLVSPEGYSHLAVPALIETGDKDIPFGVKGGDWRVHLAAFDAAPPGDTYALVLPDVDHYFGGLICRLDLPGPPQTAGLARAVDVSLDFLQAFGAGDTAARARLNGAVTASGGLGLRRK